MTSLPSFMAEMPPVSARAAALVSNDAAGGGTAVGAQFAGLLDAAAVPAEMPASAAAGPWQTETAANAGPAPAAVSREPLATPLSRTAASKPAASLSLAAPSDDPAVSTEPGLVPAASQTATGGNLLPQPGAQLPPALPPSSTMAPPAFDEVSTPTRPLPAPQTAPAEARHRSPTVPSPRPVDLAMTGPAGSAIAETDKAAAPPSEPVPPAPDPAPGLAGTEPNIAPPPPAAATDEVETTGNMAEAAASDLDPGEDPVAAPPAVIPAAPVPAAAAQTVPASAALPAAPLRARPAAGGRSELASGPERLALPQARTAGAPTPALPLAAADPAAIGERPETGAAASPLAPPAPVAAPPLAPPPILAAAERLAEPAPPAATLAPSPDAPGTRGEAAIDQVGALREALRSARPAMTLQHAEFGAVSLRLEAAAPDQWRAVLASRDPGFVPAIQAALAERALAPTATSDTASAGQHGASHSGTGDQRYGASPNGGQGGSQPYLGQSGQRDGEAAPDHRRHSTAAALAARGAGEAEEPASHAGAAGGLFA